MAFCVSGQVLDLGIWWRRRCQRSQDRSSALPIWWNGNSLKCDAESWLTSVQWKNKHADGPVSAKKPKKVKDRQRRQATKEREGVEEPPATGSTAGSTADEDSDDGVTEQHLQQAEGSQKIE